MNALSGPLIDGIILPSVTRILRSHPKQAVAKKSAALNCQRLTQADAQERGKAIHRALRSFLTTGETDIDQAYFSYWHQVQQVLNILDLKPIWADGPVDDSLPHLVDGDTPCMWSKKLHLQGCPDFLGTVGGVPVVIEWKTGTTLFNTNHDFRNFKSYWPWFKAKLAHLQCAAYSFCSEETLGFKTEASIVVNVTPDDFQLFIKDGPDFEKDRKQFKLLAANYFKKEGYLYTLQDGFFV